MAELIDPTVRLQASFLAAVSEFHEDRDYATPWFVEDIEPPALTDAAAFAAYVKRVLSERIDAAGRADAFVPMTTLWWAERDQLLGRVAIRHRLTTALEKAGGHIGYDVRPSARRQGHATAMLAAALPIARLLGITQALLTCDEMNSASQRVIETNGGQFIDRVGGERRYWVPTS